MTTTARWLIDKSALRPQVPAFADALAARVAAGHVGVCLVTELEVGFSARSLPDWRRVRDDVLGVLVPVVMPAAAETRAKENQRELVARGQHRAVAIPDLIVAAIAEIEGLTVLHYDGDFDLVAAVTGQATEWIAPPGTA